MKTLGSIYSWYYQRKTKKSHYKHSSQEKMNEYYFRYCEESQQRRHKHVILWLARQVDHSPALMARIILERHLMYTKYNNQSPPKLIVSQLLKNTQLIDDPVLALDIDVCNAADDVYGPVVETIKRSLGHEYEFQLARQLEALGLTFEDEVQLRAKGYDKTPDFMLSIPIAIAGRVVNWIESKASFGDEECHADYLENQFWSYLNRFGSGLVIYWFGFISELDIHRDKGIMLMDHLPTEFMSLDCTLNVDVTDTQPKTVTLTEDRS